MANSYYNVSGTPGTSTPGNSAPIRGEYAAIAAGFALLPPLGAGVANQVVMINSGGTAMTSAVLASLTVSTFSAGMTGFTPNSPTSGAVVLGGVLATANGGTALTTFAAANNAIYSSSASVLVAGTLPVAAGGTGDIAFTAYAPIFGGATTTDALQSGTVGTAGQVLTSNGAGAIATFQALPSAAAPALLTTLVASASAFLVDTTHITSAYKSYEFRLIDITFGTNGARLNVFVSTNGGSSYDTTSASYMIVDMVYAITNTSLVAQASAQGLTTQITQLSNVYGGFNGVITLYNPSGTTDPKGFDYRWNTQDPSNLARFSMGGGQYVGSISAINAVKIIATSGTITGNVEIWGIP